MGKLVLTRRLGESFNIRTEQGEEIKVELCQIKGKQARISIDAPRSTRIIRIEKTEAGRNHVRRLMAQKYVNS